MNTTVCKAVICEHNAEKTGKQVLLEAARLYDRSSAVAAVPFPRLLIIITGKGPGKARYLAILRALTFDRVVIRTAWLEARQYATLLACADLGVSLHTSSSDLDLPMKVSDMLGWCVHWQQCPASHAGFHEIHIFCLGLVWSNILSEVLWGTCMTLSTCAHCVRSHCVS